MTASKHFDMIKLDIEGEEKYILEDDESKAVLCEAACIFMELHERLLEGCEAAFQAFMQVCTLTFHMHPHTGNPSISCRAPRADTLSLRGSWPAVATAAVALHAGLQAAAIAHAQSTMGSHMQCHLGVHHQVVLILPDHTCHIVWPADNASSACPLRQLMT